MGVTEARGREPGGGGAANGPAFYSSPLNCFKIFTCEFVSVLLVLRGRGRGKVKGSGLGGGGRMRRWRERGGNGFVRVGREEGRVGREKGGVERELQDTGEEGMKEEKGEGKG